jgi:hypothetical protein
MHPSAAKKVGCRSTLYRSLLTTAPLLGVCACTGAFVAAGPTADVGTFAVSGLQGGIGGHLEVGKFWDRERFALGAAISGAVAGYSSAGDADPVFFTAAEVRLKRWLSEDRSRVRPFLDVGGGPVVAWVAGPYAGGLVTHLGVGFEGGRSGLKWWVALRARPMALASGQAEFFGSTQMMFGLAVR